MAKTPDTDVTIEALLEQRTQYEEWLAKLDNSGDKAPPAVRERIRGDYQARLQSVMEQLRGRGSAVSEELERHHASQAELDRQRRAAEEALAEAEVRHSVGEYAEDEWRRVSDQSRREIEELRAQLRSVGAEITRLTQVQSLIAAPRSAAPASAPPAAAPRPAPKPEVIEQAPFVTHVADPMEDPAAPPPRTAPQPPTPQPEPAAAEVDELTFLKSVSDEEPRAAPRRTAASGSSSTATSAPPREPEVQAPSPAPSGKAAAAVAKTLKCGDCGTLNRPTEWYCERCGAELAGV
ncbi:MAG TPA: zinc finger Ran-binding domain-containing protein [Gemmatimonadales bacterium]|nr:zinc finger Ran-binding domain-containing protein [Gemmatimonadales bacterium]